MPLVIPDFHSNWIITLRNVTGGGVSQYNSISMGMSSDVLTQAIVNRVANLFRDNLKTMWDAGWEIGPVHAINNDSGTLYAWDDTTVEVGTHAADTYAPPQVATIVTKHTSLLGRAYRGRVYLPGVPAGYVGEDGGINPTHVTDVNTAMAAVKTAVEADAAVGNLMLFHEASSPASSPTLITTLTARSRAGTMRPRQRR